MKAGDRIWWQMRGTDEPIEVEIVRPDRTGWWIVQPLGRSMAHFAQHDELSESRQTQRGDSNG